MATRYISLAVKRRMAEHWEIFSNVVCPLASGVLWPKKIPGLHQDGGILQTSSTTRFTSLGALAKLDLLNRRFMYILLPHLDGKLPSSLECTLLHCSIMPAVLCQMWFPIFSFLEALRHKLMNLLCPFKSIQPMLLSRHLAFQKHSSNNLALGMPAQILKFNPLTRPP